MKDSICDTAKSLANLIVCSFGIVNLPPVAKLRLCFFSKASNALHARSPPPKGNVGIVCHPPVARLVLFFFFVCRKPHDPRAATFSLRVGHCSRVALYTFPLLRNLGSVFFRKANAFLFGAPLPWNSM